MVESKKNAASGYRAYAKAFSYNAAGAVTKMQLGNGRWESTSFNSRLQPTNINLGTLQGGTDKLSLAYSYGDWVNGSIDATKNNGNIVQQVITVPTVGSSSGFTATQKYYYDELNRLDDSTETINSTQTWRQDFTYDRYGNRRFNETNTTMPTSFSNQPATNPTISTSNNRINATGYTFDASGNTIYDAALRKFTYDAENKQIKAESTTSSQTVTGTLGEYSYDGDGKRVKKFVPSTGETTIFVYDAGGKQIAEYSTIVANSAAAKVAYLTNDHLGSPRINTDANGAVTSRHDYHPFGEDIATSHRATNLGYSADTVRKQFTGYEHDEEVNLDFAQARSFSSGSGRFMSPDHFAYDTSVWDPASWNLYVYVRNNPLRFVDPTGNEIWIYYSEEETYKDKDGKTRTRTVEKQVQYKDGKLFGKDGKEYTGTNETVLKIRDDLLEIVKKGGAYRDGINDLAEDNLQHSIGHKDYGASATVRGDTSATDDAAVDDNRASGSRTVYDSKRAEDANGRTAATLARELLGAATDMANGVRTLQPSDI